MAARGIAPSLFLYALTLLPPSAAVQAVVGQFSGTKGQEIIVAQGSLLVILRPDTSLGKVVSILSHNTFGIIRSLAAFRLTGSTKDFLIVGSDSGKIVILEYKPDTNILVKVHEETFGKSGVRRVVPGQYFACDPKGRSVMITSVEKNKLVYVLNRDAAANLTISSPLEAHKSHSVLFHIIGLDVGYENPIFAALEVDYSEVDQDSTGKAFRDLQKTLTYYELDLGLNHVVKKWSDVVDRSSNMLLQVPGGADGPSGVLVCTEDFIVYRHQNKGSFRVPIPRRYGIYEDVGKKQVIVCAVMHKMRGAFFLLVQNEYGDLFKITIDYDDNGVEAVKIKYFDTVPVATSLCILKSGFLYVAAETGNHMLYQFEKLGDDDEEIEFSSADFDEDTKPYFKPRPLENLVAVDETESLNPIVDAKVLNLTNEDAPQIYALCGKGHRSTFRVLRHGLDVNELVASELPGVPTAVWTTKIRQSDEFDSYIILTFSNGTLILSIGETVEEVTDTGFLSSTPTIAVQQLGQDALIQIHPGGIRYIRANGKIVDWKAPAQKTIQKASTNNRQVAIALSSGELVYFELDNGELQEYRERKQMTGAITALSIGQVPEGRARNNFMAVACDDSTVRIISLDPSSTLDSLGVQALSAPASSLVIMSMVDGSAERAVNNIYLHIGLQNGVYLRTLVDSVTAQLTDTRLRFLGSKPIQLFKVKAQGQAAVLALSSRPWLGYNLNSSLKLTPLSYDPLEYGWSFSSEQCPEGMVGIQGQSLRIFTVEKLSDNLKQESVPLSHTPRKMVQHPHRPIFYIIESDNRTISQSVKNRLLGSQQNGEAFNLEPKDFGWPQGGPGRWASCLRILDPLAKETILQLDLDEDEAAFSITVTTFKTHGDDLFLVIGTASKAILSPKSFAAAYLHVYRLSPDGRQIELLHKTEVDDLPTALLPFQGRILVGVGPSLRIYDIGQKRLLRKCELRGPLTSVVSLHTQGNRIVIGDVADSVHFAVYKYAENRLVIFSDDEVSRYTTATALVDYETIAGGDKFGNFWLVRCPEQASKEADDDPTASHLVNEKPFVHGAPYRLKLLSAYFIGDIPTSMTKTSLVPGGREILLYTGLCGSIGILVPFVSKEDVDFFQQLEMHMKSEEPPLAGRDHLAYRGYYTPAKGCIDGDMCERYGLLPHDKQRLIAGELDRTVQEVQKKIEDMRVRGVAY